MTDCSYYQQSGQAGKLTPDFGIKLYIFFAPVTVKCDTGKAPLICDNTTLKSVLFPQIVVCFYCPATKIDSRKQFVQNWNMQMLFLM